MNKGMFSTGVFIDLKKEFDTVDHEILLYCTAMESEELSSIASHPILQGKISSYPNRRACLT